jgi:ankyrin repeat protein
VKLLLAKDGVDLDFKDTINGQTPLSWAATSAYEVVVKLLLKNGVDICIVNRGGWIVFTLSKPGRILQPFLWIIQ